MESKLTKQDLELIDKLVEDKLKHYNLIAPIQQEQPKEEVKERYGVVAMLVPHQKNDYMVVICKPYGEKMFIEEAETISTQIKALLQTI